FACHAALLSFPTRRSSDLGRPVDILYHIQAGAGATAFFGAESLVHLQAAVFLHTDTPRCHITHCHLDTGQMTVLRHRSKMLTARSEEHTSELQSRENLVCR